MLSRPLKNSWNKLAAEVAREKGVEVAPLRSVLVKLGEKGVREEDIPKRLDAAADELIKFRAERVELVNVLRAFVGREGGRERLEKAVSVYREAWEENQYCA